MKISQTNSSAVQNTGSNSEAKKSTKTEKSGSVSAANTAKKVEKSNTESAGDVKMDISSRAKEFALATDVAKATPDVREEKVAELKQKIAQSKYNIDPDRIADKLVEEHRKLAGA